MGNCANSQLNRVNDIPPRIEAHSGGPALAPKVFNRTQRRRRHMLRQPLEEYTISGKVLYVDWADYEGGNRENGGGRKRRSWRLEQLA